MKLNLPMTYEDFISQVEEAMPLDSPFRILYRNSKPMANEEVKTANDDFQFKDIEVGKIYVLWKGEDTWFLTPSSFLDENAYSLYWCYYNNAYGQVTPVGQSGGAQALRVVMRVLGWLWIGSRWKVLNDTPPFKDAFINWDKLPWGGKK